MFARHKLNTRGYIVLYRAVPEQIADELRSLSRDHRRLWINETWNGSILDEHRFRAPVPDEPSRKMTVFLQRHYKTFFPLATATGWRFDKTTEGSHDQPVRREFPTPTTGPNPANVCCLPGSIIIATQDNTYFYGYGWNNQVALRSNQQLIELNKGDVLMFRGDFVVSECGAEANNVCVHGYLDTPLYVRPTYQVPEMVAVIDDTREIDDVFCFVWCCEFKGSDGQSLRKHLNRYHGFYFNHMRTNHPLLADIEELA